MHALDGYSLKQSNILRNGKKVGTLTKTTWQLVDQAGRQHGGTVAGLLEARAKAKGPSGKLRLHVDTLEVVGGVVFFERQRIGTVDARGQYAVTLRGRACKGNMHQTPGAVWLGGAGGSGSITVGGATYHAFEGAIHEGQTVIGWLRADGSYRGVNRAGDCFFGSLKVPGSSRLLRLVSSSPEVAS